MNERDSASRETVMPGIEHYKSKETYRKANAYRHIHGIPTRAKDVVVAGKKHKVNHGKKRSRRKY